MPELMLLMDGFVELFKGVLEVFATGTVLCCFLPMVWKECEYGEEEKRQTGKANRNPEMMRGCLVERGSDMLSPKKEEHPHTYNTFKPMDF